MTEWGKILGWTALGLGLIGLGALVLSSDGEAETESGGGIPVTENPPEDIEEVEPEDDDD